MYLNARFWSHLFETSFAKQIGAFCEVLETRVLPLFANAEAEAEKVAETEYGRLGNLPGGEYGPSIDPADAAEMAQEAGLAHYELITATMQTFLNLTATALYHMFEQQLLVFHRRQVLRPAEEHDPELSTKLDVFYERLQGAGLAVKGLPSWTTISELALAAHTIKHGEGRSARRLRTMNPQLFTPPALHGTRFSRPVGTVSQPLAGEDIYVTLEDIHKYRDALLLFWREFGQAILKIELTG
jgi:hypothetical protein